MRNKKVGSLIASFLIFVLTFTFTSPSYASDDSCLCTPSAALLFLGIGGAGAIIASLLSFGDKDNPNPENSGGGVIEAEGVSFSQPGNQNLVLTNPANAPATVNSISLSNVNDVTVGSIGSGCKPVPAHGTCTVVLTAGVNAYGNGVANINYDNNKKTTANVTVANTWLELYEIGEVLRPFKEGQDIILWDYKKRQENEVRNFQYTNAGKFSWQNPQIVWQTKFDPYGDNLDYYVTLGANSCGTVAPGESCSFTLTVNDVPQSGDWGTLRTTGTNLGSAYLENVVAAGGLTITVNENPYDYHLGYRSFKITNNMSDGHNISIQTITGTDDQIYTPSGSTNLIGGGFIKRCLPTDTDCDGYNQGSSFGGIPACTFVAARTSNLAAGSSCLVWFKAQRLPSGSKDLQNKFGGIKITVNGQKYDSTKGWQNFSDYEKDTTFGYVTYEQALYAGGGFTDSEGIQLNYIAKWNGGSDWLPLNNTTTTKREYTAFGTNGVVQSLANVAGDLYVGGNFDNAGGWSANYLAKWDGSDWSSLGNSENSQAVGGTDDTVYALTGIGSDLYVGGRFFTACNAKFSNCMLVNKVAKWSTKDLEWSSLASSSTGIDETDGVVYALAGIGNNLYVGGQFTNAGGTSVNNIAKWDGSNWSALGNGITGGEEPIVYAFKNTNILSTDWLGVGGRFSMSGNYSASNIALWDATSGEWQDMEGNGTNGAVYAADVISNGVDIPYILVGGQFSEAFGASVNNIFAIPATMYGTALDMSGGVTIDGESTASVFAIASIIDSSGNTDAYVGGGFSIAGGEFASNIAKCYKIMSPLSGGWRSDWSGANPGFNGANAVNANALVIAPSLILQYYNPSYS